jgi:hypothetical protein
VISRRAARGIFRRPIGGNVAGKKRRCPIEAKEPLEFEDRF